MIKPATAALAGAAPVPKDDRQVAAKQLEAFFLRQFLKEARPESSGLMSGGFAGDTFKGMLDEQLAEKMAGGAGLGLAETFAKHLGPAAPAAPGGHPGAVIEQVGRMAGAAPGALPVAPVAGLIPGHGPTSAASALADLPRGAAGAPAFLMPVSGRPTSGYGLRKDPIHGEVSAHKGLDLAAPAGAPVAAAASGRVTHAGPAGTYGNLVTIRHADGYETRYAHLSSVAVHEGDAVTAGDHVGDVGSTGRSTGPHLHFEVRHDGEALNPGDIILPLNRSK